MDSNNEKLGGQGVWRYDELEGVLIHWDRDVLVMGSEAGTGVSFPCAQVMGSEAGSGVPLQVA